MYQFVEAFLADRRMAVKVGSVVSETRTLDMGVPQGTPPLHNNTERHRKDN